MLTLSITSFRVAAGGAPSELCAGAAEIVAPVLTAVCAEEVGEL
jgi:hypothetical protein